MCPLYVDLGIRAHDPVCVQQAPLNQAFSPG